MGYIPAAFSQFGGLNLAAEPTELGGQGAVDLRNVELDREGRLRQRNGYAHFTQAAASSPYFIGKHFDRLGNPDQFLGGVGNSCNALDANGALIASQSSFSPVNDFERFGTPTTETVFIARTGNNITKWDGSAFSSGPAFVAQYLTTQTEENRLVAANVPGTGGGTNYSSVKFSDPGDPTSFPANNYVDLSPGDGEDIRGAVSWRNMVFVFKQTKFFVFYGNSTDADGNPIFNYRTINTGIGCTPTFLGCVAGADGVYFANYSGLYVTTGDNPTRISQALDPYLRGWETPQFSLPAHTGMVNARLTFQGERLWLTLPTSAGYATFVANTTGGDWVVHDFDAQSCFPYTQQPYMMLCRTGANHIAKLAQSGNQTTDNGTPVQAFYKSGSYDLGSFYRARSAAYDFASAEKIIRETLLWGTGVVNLQLGRENRVLDEAKAVAMPGRRRTAIRGLAFTHKLSTADGPWTVDRIRHHIRNLSTPDQET